MATLKPNRATTAKEIVVRAYHEAHCARSGGLFQIRCLLQNASPGGFSYLSSQHLTEEEAWYFAATRVLAGEAARFDSERNKEAVLRIRPDAYCAAVRCGYFQIQRPRTRADKRSVLKYVPLSGRFSSQDFAWQDAAQSSFDSALLTNPDMPRHQTVGAKSVNLSFILPLQSCNAVASCGGEQNSGSRI